MTDGLRPTGWGFFPWPGEKKRRAKAKAAADKLLSTTTQKGLASDINDFVVETTYDFSTDETVIRVHAEFYPGNETPAELRALREKITESMLEELGFAELEASPADIEWSQEEVRDHGDKLTYTVVKAVLKVSGN